MALSDKQRRAMFAKLNAEGRGDAGRAIGASIARIGGFTALIVARRRLTRIAGGVALAGGVAHRVGQFRKNKRDRKKFTKQFKKNVPRLQRKFTNKFKNRKDLTKKQRANRARAFALAEAGIATGRTFKPESLHGRFTKRQLKRQELTRQILERRFGL